MYTYHMKEMLFVSTYRKTLIKFGVYAAFLLVAVLICLLPQFLSNEKQVPNNYHARFATDLKYIYFWNEPLVKKKSFHYSEKEPNFPSGQTLFIKQKCANINCFITYNKSLLRQDSNYDAIVFDLQEIRHIQLDKINLTRSQHQQYIFRSLESSEKHPLCYPFYENFFNWTWTYKLNSDIPHPYFNIYNEKNSIVGPSRNMTWLKKMKRTNRFKNKLKHKKKAMAWVVSKCKLKAKHKDFLDELQTELTSYNYSLDIYGPCGKNECPHGYKCFKMIERDYYFQLVLEDSFAEDYVTEKIAKVMMHMTIPIVLGGADYNNFLPPGSYINARSFNMKKLGAVIDYLMKNPKMYEYFFDWMNHYYYSPRPNNYFCDLCAKLNSNNSFNYKQAYRNFREWWNPDYKEICHRLQLYNYFSKDYYL